MSGTDPVGRRRRLVVWGALGLALVLLLAGSLTLWVKRQALDTNNWVDTSATLLENEDVRAAVAAELVDGLFSGPGVETRIRELLPPEAAALAAPAAGLLRQAALPAAEELLGRPAVQQLWKEANRLAHEALIALIEGEQVGPLTTGGGAVVLDLQPLVARLGQRLGIAPQLTGERARITILSSEELGAVQDAAKTIKALSVLILIAVAALVVLAVYLAEGFRRRVLLVLGAGLIGVGALLLVVERLVGRAVVDALTDPATREAGAAVWLIGTSLLRDLALGLLVYGVVLLAGVWLAGPARLALAARRRLAPAVAEHMPWVYGVVAALFLALLIWGPTAGSRRLLGTLILAALVVAGVETLRRQILAESEASGGGAL